MKRSLEDTNKQPSVQLEDLLKLKRQEQPEADFWNRFDTQLQAKTLQALVTPRSLRVRVQERLQLAANPLFAMPAAALLVLTVFLGVSHMSPALQRVDALVPHSFAQQTAAPEAAASVAEAVETTEATPVVAVAEVIPTDELSSASITVPALTMHSAEHGEFKEVIGQRELSSHEDGTSYGTTQLFSGNSLAMAYVPATAPIY